jgi:hypothetical protein
LKVPSRRYENIEYSHGVFVLYSKGHSVYVYNHNRQEHVYSFYSTADHEFYDYGAIQHDEFYKIESFFWITKTNKHKSSDVHNYYLNYIRFLNDRATASSVLQEVTEIPIDMEPRGLWLYN